jgi:hypothetical protein
MYIVRDNQGQTVAVCTRREDAEAYARTKLDNVQYTVEKT